MENYPSIFGGITQGVQQGLQNAHTLTAVKQQRDSQMENRVNASLQMLSKNYLPKAVKLQIYNQNVRPYFANMGQEMPELQEWPDMGDALAKKVLQIRMDKEMGPRDKQQAVLSLMAEGGQEYQDFISKSADILGNEASQQDRVNLVARRQQQVGGMPWSTLIVYRGQLARELATLIPGSEDYLAKQQELADADSEITKRRGSAAGGGAPGPAGGPRVAPLTGAPTAQPGGMGSMIRVKSKRTGRVGLIPADKFSDDKWERM